MPSQFSQPCPCGGKTSHKGNLRAIEHEKSKKHLAYLKLGSAKTELPEPKPSLAPPA